MADKVGLTVANFLQHLQLLRLASLVASGRAGKAVIYRMADDKTLIRNNFLGGIAKQNLKVVDEVLQGLSDDRHST